MNLVADVYQGYEQTGDAFTGEDGKNYINVKTEEGVKAVRVFTIEQYNFLAGMQHKKNQIKAEQAKLAQSYNEERRINAGFKNGYIIAILGDTYDMRDVLKSHGAKFSPAFKWHFEGGSEPGVSMMVEDGYKLEVMGFDTRKILWEEASERAENGCIKLKPSNELKKLLEVETELKEGYEFQGEIGDLLSKTVVVKRNKVLDGPWGRFVVNVMEDMEGNVYVMNTSVAEMLKRRLHVMKLRVVDHTVFEGIKQTVVVQEEWFDEEDSNS